MAQDFYVSRKANIIFLWGFGSLCFIGLFIACFLAISSLFSVREVAFEIDTRFVQTEFELGEEFTADSFEDLLCYVVMSDGSRNLLTYDIMGLDGFYVDNSRYNGNASGEYEIIISYKNFTKCVYTVFVLPENPEVF